MTRLLKVPEVALRLISEKTTWKAISSSDFATGIQSVNKALLCASLHRFWCLSHNQKLWRHS
jgi:hypothetical protein